MPIPVPELETRAGDDERDKPSGPRIRCPLCGWTPSRQEGHTPPVSKVFQMPPVRPLVPAFRLV